MACLNIFYNSHFNYRFINLLALLFNDSLNISIKKNVVTINDEQINLIKLEFFHKNIKKL